MPSEPGETSSAHYQKVPDNDDTSPEMQERISILRKSMDETDNHAVPSVDYKSIRRSPKLAAAGKSTNFFMYLSHFLTKWGERMWQFAAGLFMVYIDPDSLQLTAVYGLSMGACVLLFGPVVGDWVDNTQRLKAARVSLVVQTLFVVLCSGVIYAFLVYRDDILAVGEWTRYVTYTSIILFSGLSLLANTANTITVEKDWIVEICGDDQERLATMTARMRGIDLTTQILAPVATGQIMTFIGVQYGAVFIACWNVVTVIIEYYLIWKVYKTIPALSLYKDVSKTISGKNKTAAAAQDGDGSDDTKSSRCRMCWGLYVIIEGWKTYARSDVMLSGLALAFLFLTVLGFDSVTVGYANIQGLSGSVVGGMMGGAGFIGIMGTFAYPVFRQKLGLPRSGLLGLILQVSCLSLCVVSIWLPGSPFDPMSIGDLQNNTTNTSTSGDSDPVDGSSNSMISVLVLMSGIIGARFGLWVADLSITQMFMQTVKEEERGVVFGVQNSINRLMGMFKYGLVTGLPFAPQFGFLILISFFFITLGNVLYVTFLCRVPSELFPKKQKKNGGSDYTKI